MNQKTNTKSKAQERKALLPRPAPDPRMKRLPESQPSPEKQPPPKYDPRLPVEKKTSMTEMSVPVRAAEEPRQPIEKIQLNEPGLAAKSVPFQAAQERQTHYQ